MGNEKIIAEGALLQPSALVSFFVIDATELGGGVLHLTPFVSGTATSIFWQGVEFNAYPIEFDGHELRGQGTMPRPRLRLGNLLGTISALCINYGNLIGATVTRRRTFAKYLDGMPGADPLAALPDDIFEIDRKSSEDRNTVEFELASALEVDGVFLPRRQVMSGTCGFIYRSPECGFTGNMAVANKEDVRFLADQTFRGEWAAGTTYVHKDVVWRQITRRAKRFYFAKLIGGNVDKQPPNSTYWGEDLCSLRLTGCGLRFPNEKPFGAFPGTHKVQGT